MNEAACKVLEIGVGLLWRLNYPASLDLCVCREYGDSRDNQYIFSTSADAIQIQRSTSLPGAVTSDVNK